MQLRKEAMKYFPCAMIALTLANATAALGQASELPIYDADKYCKKEADIYLKDPTMLKVCLDDEQKAYSKLKKRWSTLDNIVKINCLPVPAELGSYYKVMVCISHELKEEEELHEFKFKR
jgi:hypothetical protein